MKGVVELLILKPRSARLDLRKLIRDPVGEVPKILDRLLQHQWARARWSQT
jgi:hypothetical protein